MRWTLIALAAAAAVVVGVVAWIAIDLTRPPDARTARSVGEATIGGDFELVDGDGRTWRAADLHGEYPLIYFGFTFCPDVCPTELAIMAEAVERLGPEGEKVRPVFISVDPERDTPDMVQQYAANFHERMLGLTGTPEQVAQAAKAWRVYYRKAEDDKSTEYLVDHTSIVYLMGPDGNFLTHFGPNTPPERMAETIRRFLDE